jgi:C1A family cysteine protease
VSVRFGYIPGPEEPSLPEQETLALEATERALGAAEATYPDQYDLRDVNAQDFITPVQDQGPCLSCVAFGVCAAIEGTLRVQNSDPTLDVDLSEAQLYYCVARAQGRRCHPPNGGWNPAAALDSAKDAGVPDEQCFRYTAGDQECAVCSDWKSRTFRITEWRLIQTPAEMKSWIASRGPLVGSMQLYKDIERYAGGIYRHLIGDPVGGHCICIVGYSDTDSCWIVKNSWGKGWGEGGYFRIAYGECGIDSFMWAIEGVVPPAG